MEANGAITNKLLRKIEPPPGMMENMDAEIERLKDEIKQEEQARDMLIQSIGDLQSTANELNYELQGLEEEQSGEDEWQERYDEQLEMNKNMEKQIMILNDKMKELNMEIENTGKNGNSSDLDQLNEIELKRLIKQLGREKHELRGCLKDLEWQLDTEAKARYKIYEEIQEYKVMSNEIGTKLEVKKQRAKDVKPVTKHQKNDLQDLKAKFHVTSKIPSKNRYYGIPDNQRIIDPRKGPVKRTAAAGHLPKIDSRDGSNSVKSSPGPQESKSHVQTRGFNSAENARTKTDQQI